MSLRDSMKKLSFAKKKNQKILKLKNGDQVNVKFLPYISDGNEPKSDKEIWYHYNKSDRKSYLCSGKFNGCPICEEGLKPTQRRYSNVQIIQSNNVDIKENEYYLFYIPWYLHTKIEESEQKTGDVVFSIFDSPEVALISSLNNNGHETIEESYITDSSSAMISDIDEYEDEDLIEMLKLRTRNLEEVVEETIEKTTSFPFKNKPVIQEVEKQLIKREEVKEIVAEFSEETEINVVENEVSKIEVPVVKKTRKSVMEEVLETEEETEEVEIKEEEVVETEVEKEEASNEESSEDDTLDYINSYLEGIK